MTLYARAHSAGFGRVLAMPNTSPALVSPGKVNEYRSRAEKAAPGLEVLTAFRIMPDTTADRVIELSAAGIPAGKYYPDGVTTNSAGGLTDWRQIRSALAAMEESGMVLCLHGEDPSAPVLSREEAFLPAFREIRREFPRLKMILEHVSSAVGVRAVAESDGPTAATITVQHLLYTLDDLLGGLLNPHLFCKPVVKFSEDRQAIRDRILAGDSRFFFGSDSAPHLQKQKESDCCPAGAYTAPMALPALVSWFEKENAMDRIEPFLCDYGRQFYDVPPNPGTVTLEKHSWTVPSVSEGCVPLMAGETLPWKVLDR